jgi:hypothetical protein
MIGAEGVVQVVQCLPSKIKVLSLNPSTTKKKKNYSSQASWFTPVILVTQEVETGRTTVQGQTRKKVHKTPSQPIKAECGGIHLSSQLHRNHKQDGGPGWPTQKRETLFIKYLKAKRLGVQFKW